jgi:hypothetical protein
MPAQAAGLAVPVVVKSAAEAVEVGEAVVDATLAPLTSAESPLSSKKKKKAGKKSFKKARAAQQVAAVAAQKQKQQEQKQEQEQGGPQTASNKVAASSILSGSETDSGQTLLQQGKQHHKLCRSLTSLKGASTSYASLRCSSASWRHFSHFYRGYQCSYPPSNLPRSGRSGVRIKLAMDVADFWAYD